MRTHTKSLSSLVLLGALLFACSGNSSGSGGSGGSGGGGGSGASCATVTRPADPCPFITEAQLTNIVGMTLDQTMMQAHQCTWLHQKAPNDLVDGVSVTITVDADYQGTFRSDCADNPGIVMNVSGIGDDACFVNYQGASSNRTTELDTLKGCLTLSVNLEATGTYQAQYPDATIQADEKAIALAVLPNLK